MAALNPRELFESGSDITRLPVEAHRIMPKRFAAGTGTLAKLAPVAFNTSSLTWVPWDADGANGADTIKGLVWPDEIVLDADEEVLGHVLLEGIVRWSDLLAAALVVDTAAVEADVLAAVDDELRTLGIHVQGKEQIR